jgi:hypothetical protein
VSEPFTLLEDLLSLYLLQEIISPKGDEYGFFGKNYSRERPSF